MESNPAVRNPLTVIAIFAGIAEVSGTIVLPLVDAQLQSTFMWFVMGFPCLLVVLFFLTLNFNHEVLYAPSDFRDDEAFLKAKSGVRADARADKLQDDLAYVDEPEEAATSDSGDASGQSSRTVIENAFFRDKRSARAMYFLAEELVLQKLANEINGTFQRESTVSSKGGDLLFDATIADGPKLTAIEVKYFPTGRVNPSIIRNTLQRIANFYHGMSNSEREGFSLIFAIATDAPKEQHDEIKKSVTGLAAMQNMPLQVRVFDLGALDEELAKKYR